MPEVVIAGAVRTAVGSVQALEPHREPVLDTTDAIQSQTPHLTPVGLVAGS